MNDLSRRDVLRKGAIASGALIVGGTVTGSVGAHRPNGGVAFVTSSAYPNIQNTDFLITDEVSNLNWNPTAIPVSCHGNSDLIDHVPYQMKDSSSNNLGWIFFKANKNVKTDDHTLHEIHNAEEDCNDVSDSPGHGSDSRTWVKVRVKPATPGGP